MSAAYDAIVTVRELHRPEPSDVECQAETYSWDHYRSEQVDGYWIRCQATGRHDEHSDSGNTGLTWALTDVERHEQARIPAVCAVDYEPYPCPTVQLLADVQPPAKYPLA